MIPGHVRDGVLTEATNDYAGPILPGFRETAWIQKSPYFHRAAKHGVRAYDLYNHMLMPGLYTDPVDEYWHLVNHVTLWDVGVERQVEIDGPDGFEFMQMLTPRDMQKCAVGECKYVLLTTPEGGIINDPVLLRLGENHFWLSLSDWDVIFWCKGVAVNAGLDVVVREPDVSPLQLQGPKSKDVIAALFGEEILDLEYYHLRETELDGIPLVITRTGWSAERGYELYVRDSKFGERLWDAVIAAGAKHDIRPIAPSEIRRIEAGILNYSSDIMLDNNPYEIGLGWTVDEDKKSDYLGKAALARIKEEGVKRKLVGIEVEGSPLGRPEGRPRHLVDVLAAAREEYRLCAPGHRSREDRHGAAGVDDERNPRGLGGEEAVRRPEEGHSEVVRSPAVKVEVARVPSVRR